MASSSSPYLTSLKGFGKPNDIPSPGLLRRERWNQVLSHGRTEPRGFIIFRRGAIVAGVARA